jgi:hypothetical protein
VAGTRRTAVKNKEVYAPLWSCISNAKLNCLKRRLRTCKAKKRDEMRCAKVRADVSPLILQAGWKLGCFRRDNEKCDVAFNIISRSPEMHGPGKFHVTFATSPTSALQNITLSFEFSIHIALHEPENVAVA